MLSCLENRPIKESEIARDEQGRPFLPGYSRDFNISHSGFMAAISLVSGISLRTGCDIQMVRPGIHAKEIAEGFFTAAERDYIYAGKNKQSEENRFFAIWTLKECFLKLRGLSVFTMASAPSFIGKGAAGGEHFSFDTTVSLPLSFRLYELSSSNERYFLAAAIEGAEQAEPEIRWCSQSFLPCRSIAKIKAAPNPARTVNPKM